MPSERPASSTSRFGGRDRGPPLGIHPVVVGCVAVYFWTASDEFPTYDIDVVMEVPKQLADVLAQIGFARTPDGRHWLLEGTGVFFLEAPSARLDDDALVTKVELPSGRTAMTPTQVIEEIGARLARAAPPKSRVLLFGSHARGTADDGSDFDVLVIEPTVESPISEAIRLRRELRSLGVPIDVVVMDEAKAKRRASVRGTMVERALREGRLLAQT